MKRYNVGQYIDGTDVKVDGIPEFWETAQVESLAGARFSLRSYAMMCFDDLPPEIRDALRNSRDDRDTVKVWDFLRRKNWSIPMVLNWIKELDNEGPD